MKKLFCVIWSIILLNACRPGNTIANVVILSGSHENYIQVSDIKTNVIEKDYHKVIILGAGSQAVRLFLDNLSEKLKDDFHKKNIQTQYYYLGDEKAEEQNNYDRIISTETFDALLVFRQDGFSAVTQKSQTYPFGFWSTKLDQDISMKIYEASAPDEFIWSAALAVNCNFTKDKVYAAISSQIFKNFQENKICK